MKKEVSRLPYHAPELREHGSVEDLTLAGGSVFDPTDSAMAYGDCTPGLS
ncbi:MAG TPA: lasso RiPP family leader peptide-containing protein [Longimicrobiaceae bacterium]|nr:lasso RiPP family leader peptide-containing protein [Longimicrobiaceae bacterium]